MSPWRPPGCGPRRGRPGRRRGAATPRSTPVRPRRQRRRRRPGRRRTRRRRRRPDRPPSPSPSPARRRRRRRRVRVLQALRQRGGLGGERGAGRRERGARHRQPARLVDGPSGELDQHADGDQAAGRLDGHATLAALADEREERLVGPAVGRDRRPADPHDLVVGRVGIGPPAQGGDRGGDVAPAGRDRAQRRRPQRGAGATRPEDHADDEADGRPDGDVAEADETRLPALRLQQVEQHDDEHRERRLADDVVDGRRGVRRQEHGDRQQRPQEPIGGRDADQPGGREEAEERAGEALEHREAGRQGVAAQHAERAEGDPEGVRDIAGEGDGDGDAQGQPVADRFAEPERVVGQLGADERASAQDERAEGAPADGVDVRHLVGQLLAVHDGDVVAERQHGVGDRQRAEGQLEPLRRRVGSCRVAGGGTDLGVEVVDPALAQGEVRLERHRRQRPQGVRRRPQVVGVRAQQRDVAGVDRVAVREQPGQVERPRRVLHRPHDRPVAGARTDRPTRRRAPAGPGVLQVLASPAGEGVDGRATGIVRHRLEEIGERVARRGQRSADLAPLVDRPQQHARERRAEAADDPADHAVGHRTALGRQGDGEDVGQREGWAAGHGVAAEQAGQAHEEGDDGHAEGGEHDPLGEERRQHDQDGADRREHEVPHEPLADRATEVRHRHQAERAERREDRHRRPVEDEAAEGEQDRHDDHHAQRPPQDDAVRIMELPAQQAGEVAGLGGRTGGRWRGDGRRLGRRHRASGARTWRSPAAAARGGAPWPGWPGRRPRGWPGTPVRPARR